MKIGLFTESYLPDPNGVATTVAATARELEKMGHTVYIIAPKHPGYKDEKNVIRLYSMRVVEKLEMRTALMLPEKNLYKILRLDLDIIHGHGGGTVSFIGWEIARIKNTPFIGTYHTLAHEYTHYFLRGKVITPPIVKTITRIFGNMNEQLIAPTERAKKELRKLGVKSPIAILPSGIDRSLFQSQQRGFLKEMLNLPKTTKIVLYVGRLGKEKSVEFLLKSFSHVALKNPHVVLVFVGDGPDKKNLIKLAAKLKIKKQVYFPGFIKHTYIPGVYADSDLFVFASKTETQGMAPIEALTAGLPVVAIKDKALSELISDGYNGYLTKRREKDFAKKIIDTLSNEKEYKKMQKNAVESTKKYSLEESTRKLEHVYIDFIREHKNRKTSPLRKTLRGAKRIIKLLSELE